MTMIPGHDDGVREQPLWEWDDQRSNPSPMHTIYNFPPTPMVTSSLATASLVCGILGLVFGCCTLGLFSFLAIILGHLAMREIRINNLSGQGSAMAGLVMGYILFFPMIMLSTYFVLTAL